MALFSAPSTAKSFAHSSKPFLPKGAWCLLGGESAVYGALYQAIGVLPEKQRLVMVRHYGLGCAPESLNIISRRLFPRSPRNAHFHHKRALVVLHRTLGPTFPILSRAAGGAQ